jgi:hypothetical protein
VRASERNREAVSVDATPERSERSGRTALAGPGLSAGPAAMIALQRAAGNAAASAAMGRASPARTLARCAGACHCGGGCRRPQDPELEAFGSRTLARAVADRRTLQRMAACPSRLADADPVPAGWKPYNGNSAVFHCGFRGILEDRTPTPSDPMNECFYDHSGQLVDAGHEYASCGGTPDQYYSGTDPIKHATIDSGGIARAGGPAFVQSRLHDLDENVTKPIARWFEQGMREIYGYPF